MSNASKLGANFENSTIWDGGIFDWTLFDYSTLASKYSDAGIIGALYSNTFGAGGTHLFNFELGKSVATGNMFMMW